MSLELIRYQPMPPIYTQEHLLFQDSVRRFCAAEILPSLTSWEEKRFFPNELFPKLGAQGFLGIFVDEQWGGVSGDYLMAGAWCEEFGRVPAVGLTTGVNMHSLVVAAAVNRFGSGEAKEQWLQRAVAGTAIGAYAFTEPGVGSDLFNLKTKAVPDGDYFIINGAKTFITNGARADFIIALTRTSHDKGYGGFTTFVIDTKTPGFKVNRTLSKIGWHSSDTAELSFTDMRIHKSMVLGTFDHGWYHAMSSLEWERLMLTLGALGGARECLEKTVTYVNDRGVFGASIGSYNHTRELLASLWAKLETGRALAHHCLDLLQGGKRCRKEVSLAKLFVCELAVEVADRCLQLHGGYGYTTEFLPERWLRDLRLNPIGGGTSEIMANVVAKDLRLL